MGLTITNQYSASLSAAIMFWSPDTCSGEGGDWQMMGWWNIDPGGSAFVYANDLEDLNRYWYYYAYSSDGARWAGDGSWVRSVPTAAFNQCFGAGVVGDTEEVDFRQLDIDGNDDWTLNLTP
jgi:uncharacterized membrane protein